MLAHSPNDARFYTAIHHLVKRARDHGHERRQSTRHDTSSWLHVAPFEGGRFPTASAFRPVQCLNLSQHGVCLLMLTRPDCRQLIVALGGPPFALMVAKVVNRTEVYHKGRTRYRIGCNFLRRVDR